MWKTLCLTILLLINVNSKLVAIQRKQKHITVNPVIAGDNSKIKDDEVTFYLYNTKVNNYKVNVEDNGKKFYEKDGVKILIHGWGGDNETFWYSPMRSAYVKKGFNVVLVDWSLEAQTNFNNAVNKIPFIAEVITQFVIELSKTIVIEQFHLIGHCLGAHIAGVVDSGLNGMGLNRTIGQINFFPNGGIASQPGCLRFPCSHNRAALYFQESITSKNFIARKCDNFLHYTNKKCSNNLVNILGDKTYLDVKGDFYLSTSSQSPFGLGDT
ncbi:pancreatic triacylglycerol lipase-like isoform X2 [Onthophagus taurus]|uniref:pancreatic triacylglycerol lipase-like isoform X2 n=1 Tax=Onthophagus taurus TaxID=166361 RepID=UPI0039BDDB61